MNTVKELRPRAMAAVKVFLVFPAFLFATACSSDNHGQAAVSTEPSSSLQSAATASTNFQVQVSPALTPNFDPSIHDYVINCTSAPEVLFTAWFSEATKFGFFGPGERWSSQLPNLAGPFQKTLTLSPGQRFRFVVGLTLSAYSVRCLPPDFPPLSVSIAGIREAEWYLFAPTIYLTPPSKPSAYVIITDANGTPIWWKDEPAGLAIDAKILGTHQITWTVLNTLGGPVQYVIRNLFGQVINTISNDLDIHDLQPTASGTFLAIRTVPRTCPPDCADMSPWGGASQMSVLDQEILELDKFSNVVWTWRTRDHVALSESGGAGWFAATGQDIIHMNAVEPDGTDAVLFSARHLNAIYRITKSTGAIDWKIGGTNRPESLVVIGDIRPTAMGANGRLLSGQHDVRQWPDGTVSVQDNGTLANRPPSVIRYKIDTAARTALVVEQFQDMNDAASFCCGSARRMPGGHWLVQWGGLPYLTEVGADHNSVLTIHYNLGTQFSYRAVPILPGTVDGTLLRVGMDAMVSLNH